MKRRRGGKPSAGDANSSNGEPTGDAKQWLVGSDPMPANGAKNGGTNQGSNGRRSGRKRPRGRSPRERWLDSRLRRAQQRLRDQEALTEELKQRLAEFEQAPGAGRPAPPAPTKKASTSAKPKSPARSKGAAKTAKAKKPTRTKPAAKTNGRRGKLDLNRATFEQLRGLGLSVTRSARVVAYRDAHDGFESIDDLSEIPGFSQDTLSDLRERVQVANGR